MATQVAADAFGTLRSSAGDTVRLIRAFAERTLKPPTVYNLAQIPPPASPPPAPPPAQPTELTVTLNASDGGLLLRWKASNPAGTSGTAYIIRRKLPQDSEFSFIGVSGRKEFLDETLSFGSAVREGIHAPAVQYTVQGQRADSSGPLSPIFTVNFGRLPGGGMTASVTSEVREGIHAPASTVNGQPVQKVLPNGSGRATRANSRV